MVEQLPQSLSPKLKLRLLRGEGANEVLEVLARVGTGDEGRVREEVVKLGGTVRSVVAAGLMVLEMPASKLRELANIRGIAYAESGEAYSGGTALDQA